jgi:hypothetical protein
VEHADQVLRLALDLDKPEEFLMRKGIGELTIPAVIPGENVRERGNKSGAVKH